MEERKTSRCANTISVLPTKIRKQSEQKSQRQTGRHRHRGEGKKRHQKTPNTAQSLVAAFHREMDSGTILLSKKRTSCLLLRDAQVICSDWCQSVLIFLTKSIFILNYRMRTTSNHAESIDDFTHLAKVINILRVVVGADFSFFDLCLCIVSEYLKTIDSAMSLNK